MPPVSQSTTPPFVITKERTRLLGLTWDECIQAFFGGNAFMAVVILGLITLFLFREGADFFPENRANLKVYREAGLEYVDYIRQQTKDHEALTRYLSDIRLRAVKYYVGQEHLTYPAANERLKEFDDFADRYGNTVQPVRDIVSDMTDQASATKTEYLVNRDREEERRQLLAAGDKDAAAAVKVEAIDFKAKLEPLLLAEPAYEDANHQFAADLTATIATVPALPTPELQARMKRFQELTRQYIAGFPAIVQQLKSWDYTKPVPMARSITTFLFGRDWLTASFWQDWYGILPLLTGSLMVAFIALCIAVPLGVGAAIYINQIASPLEQRIIKPSIEFISAIPSVVLGFFGIAVLGQALRAMSQVEWLSWIPGFPFAERLNALTAGCLLALIAVPTIFTLAEDAINNVPRSFKEASFALGATRLQTIIRIIVPASLSGIVSAVLLGLGRVIGETMVVLLCAGNRIAIPDFTKGLAVIVEPVHTMTGIIAQEMGEVARGTIHYRALFMVGIVLFFLALLINFLAQKIVRKYRISIG
ncbi:MAG TPA: phosphate ABC transporter permease subunit PstC [Rariglobus sp.]|jgi:phosphate transport system permease protein|nr:phosphate ABC transporter permease subunit PstC [Rariglobus sp.]